MSSEFYRSKLEDYAVNLRNQIQAGIHNRGTDKAFITEKDLEHTLNQKAIAELLQLPSNASIVRQIEVEYRKVLAILVYCSAPGSTTYLEKAIFSWRNHADSSSVPTDKHLPLESPRANKTFGHHGDDDQYIFCAIILQEGIRNHKPAPFRLPFIGMKEEIGRGSAGVQWQSGGARAEGIQSRER
jgi:hypothetical protein